MQSIRSGNRDSRTGVCRRRFDQIALAAGPEASRLDQVAAYPADDFLARSGLKFITASVNSRVAILVFGSPVRAASLLSWSITRGSTLRRYSCLTTVFSFMSTGVMDRRGCDYPTC